MSDEQLEKIRLRRLREIKRKFSPEKKGGEAGEGQTAPTGPIEVTDVTFAEIVGRHPLVVIDCWASWCAPCRMLAPIIDELARDHAGKILFAKLNVDENHGTALKYEIMSIPTLLVFKNGKLANRIVGAMPRNMLEPKITSYL